MKFSIRLRLTLWYTALLAGALLLFSVTVYLLMSRVVLNNLDTALHDRITQASASVDVSNGRIVVPTAAESPDIPIIPAVVLSLSGRPFSGRLPAGVRQWLAQNGSNLPSHFASLTVGPDRLATAPFRDNTRIVGYVAAWQSTKDVDTARRSLILVMVGIGPALLLVSIAGGLLLARRALAPVARITHTASRISASDLSQRVPVDSVRDEVQELATTFNAMIDRLQSAVERERRFTADASHELRSPLAVIRAEATLALERPRQQQAYQRTLASIDEQARAMEEMVAALLLLAREETAPGAAVQSVALADIVDAAVSQCRHAMQQRKIRVVSHLGSDLSVIASVPLLTQAVRNVVDNAVKASPSQGLVIVDARREGDRLVLAVTDEGPGISAADQQRIFEPFYQVADARTPGSSHGLGLAICRRIIQAHGGEVEVFSSPGHGARFDIILPLSTIRESAPDRVMTPQEARYG